MGNEETSKPNVFIGLKGVPNVWPMVRPLVNGGTTCIFALPFELTKVRVQLGQGSAGHVVLNILKNEGIAAFYKGFSAGLLREVSHLCAMEALFKKILARKAIGNNDRKELSLSQKALLRVTVHAVLAFAFNPADLALTRIQADATLPAVQRRNYTNVFQAFYRILADEGVLALWKGSGSTLVRSLAMDAGFHASSYPSVVLFRRHLGFDQGTCVLGIFASACSMPFDYIKTQIQNMQPDAGAKYPYTGSFDCAFKTLKSGGIQKFYTGLPLYFVRVGVPQVMFAWLLLKSREKSVRS